MYTNKSQPVFIAFSFKPKLAHVTFELPGNQGTGIAENWLANSALDGASDAGRGGVTMTMVLLNAVKN